MSRKNIENKWLLGLKTEGRNEENSKSLISLSEEIYELKMPSYTYIKIFRIKTYYRNIPYLYIYLKILRINTYYVYVHYRNLEGYPKWCSNLKISFEEI